MKNLKILAFALTIALPLCFVSCSKDDNNRNGSRETILLKSAMIEAGNFGGMIVGMRFNYDENNNITEGYDYFLNKNTTTQQMDTSNYNKYVFDRSAPGVVSVKMYYYDDSNNRWDPSSEKKLIYSGSKLSKVETYYSGTLNNTETLTWSGDKVVRIEANSWVADSAKYNGNNYVDFPPAIREYSYTTAYIKNTNTVESTFGSKNNFLNLIPFEFAICMNFRQQIAPMGEYFSKNALSKVVKTYLGENYEADKTTKRNTQTSTTILDYTYTYGNVSSVYPSVVKQAITEKHSYVDHLNAANSTNNENKYETVINLSLIKK